MFNKNSNYNGGFDFVPKEARGCMTDSELDEAISSMGLSPDEGKALREVCRKGFVVAPELMETGEEMSEDDEVAEYGCESEFDVDKCLASGNYHEIATNVFYDMVGVNRLIALAISRVHRLERLTSLNCPDIITTNEARMAREKIEAVQIVLDGADEALRKLQLKTDRRTDEERLLDAIFSGDAHEKKEG